MKVVADTNIPFAKEAFAGFGEVDLVPGRELRREQVRDADILLVRSVTRVDAALLEGSRVGFVGTATSGTDHIDQDYLLQRGIAFASAPGSNARSVAEYVLAAVLVLIEERGRRLEDITAAIVGCGQVGTRVAELLTAAGVRCLLNDPPLKDLTGESCFHDLDEALSADIITLHVPLTTTGKHPTYRLFDESVLSRLKPDAILINTARGGVVNEEALLRRLKQQPAMTAVVDCWADEPNINPELLDRVALGTPHIAGYSFDGKLRATEMLYQAACRHYGMAADWQLPVQVQAGPLQFPDGMSDADILRQAVLACYDAREDAAAFKRAMAEGAEERGVRFDALRRNYRQRREFCAYDARLPLSRDLAARTLRRMGFKVNQQEVSRCVSCTP
jgi:erythronate-4-phosphate dehydrogenase